MSSNEIGKLFFDNFLQIGKDPHFDNFGNVDECIPCFSSRFIQNLKYQQPILLITIFKKNQSRRRRKSALLIQDF